MDEPLPLTEQADLDLLTGPTAGELLGAALAAEGLELGQWRVNEVHHRPGAGVSVGYAVTPAGGPEDYLVASTATVPAAPGPRLIRLEAADKVVHVWRHPADPALPALAAVCRPGRLGLRLGLDDPPAVELLTYRPLRRAVARVSSPQLPDGVVFAKVVAPQDVAALVGRHSVLNRAGVPVPEVLHAGDDGLVVIRAGRGTPLAALLAAGLDDPAAVLAELVGVLDRLPAAALELPRRPAWAERSAAYAHAAKLVAPQYAARIDRLAAGVADALRHTDAGPVIPSHGDFYEANVLMTDGRVSALLDVDSLGPGHRVDDLACLLAHVSVLPHLAPDTYPEVPAILEHWTRLCAEQVDTRSLHARAAGVTLSLIAGARRPGADDWQTDAAGRLKQAERWLAGATTAPGR